MNETNALDTSSAPGSPQNSAEYLGLVLDREGVAEWEDGQRTVFIRRDEVRDLIHEVGWRSERPIVQALFGATLLAAGLLSFVRFVSEYIQDGDVYLPKIFTGLGITLPILGAWALFGAMRRGHFLRATLVNGDSRKLLLQGGFDAAEFEAFVSQARTIGYSIRTS